jgi:hypothetical protein
MSANGQAGCDVGRSGISEGRHGISGLLVRANGLVYLSHFVTCALRSRTALSGSCDGKYTVGVDER